MKPYMARFGNVSVAEYQFINPRKFKRRTTPFIYYGVVCKCQSNPKK